VDSNAVYDGSSPIVSTKYDLRDTNVLSKCSDVVGSSFVGVKGGGFGSRTAAVAHHVWRDDTVPEGGEEGNLVTPAEREVGPPVDEEDGRNRGGGGGRFDVSVS